jgi:hypothetical protein
MLLFYPNVGKQMKIDFEKMVKDINSGSSGKEKK